MASLSDRGSDVVATCLEVARVAGLDSLRDELALALSRLDRPLQVAIVGQIKTGKSTLVNALVGEELLATGQLELTFNVTEIVHGERPRLTVTFKDGRPPECHQPGQLEHLTARSDENREYLSAIERVKLEHPTELLRSFSLVDTPGLNSIYDTDSENTLRYLGLTEEEIEAGSGREASSADAVVYLFNRGLAASDATLVEELRDPSCGSVTPLSAVGVLSRCDSYWPPERDGNSDPLEFDPLETARRIADRYLAIPAVGSMFYTIQPVIGLLGSGAATMTGEEIEWLERLSRLDPRLIARRAGDLNLFVRQADDLALSPQQRHRLAVRLGGFGVHCACRLLRDGCTEEELRRGLRAASGLGDLEQLLLAHFGGRAQLIKLDRSTTSLLGSVRTLRRLGAAGEVLDQVGAALERFRQGEHAFAELDVLQALYRRELGFPSAERGQILAATGERGTTCAARLGLVEATAVDLMEDLARQRVTHWSYLAMDPRLDQASQLAAQTIRRSFERIAFHVSSARRHLHLEEL